MNVLTEFLHFHIINFCNVYYSILAAWLLIFWRKFLFWFLHLLFKTIGNNASLFPLTNSDLKSLILWYLFKCFSILNRDLLTLYSKEWAFLVAQAIKRLPAMQETWVWSLGREDPLEKEMATHSSILAWRIPWTEEPGRLTQSRTRLSNFTSLHSKE